MENGRALGFFFFLFFFLNGENFHHVISIKMVHMAIKTINKHFMSFLRLLLSVSAAYIASRARVAGG